MKLNLIFFWLTISFQLTAQVVRIIPKYVEADPLWSNRIINKNFVRAQGSSLDSLGSHGVKKILEIDSFIYVIFRAFDPKTFYPNNGYILHKINKKSGQTVWTDTYTPVNGSPGSLLVGGFRVRDDKNIEVLGDRKISFDDGLTWDNFPLSFRRVYDHKTGAILGTYFDKINKAIAGNNAYKYGRYKTIKEDSLYLVYFFNFHYENGDPKFGMRFALINGEMNMVQDSIASPLYEPGIPKGPFTFGGVYNEMVNDSTMVWLFINFSTDHALYPHKVGLVFIDIKDHNNIYVKKKINIEDKLRVSDIFNKTPKIEVINNEIYIFNENIDTVTFKSDIVILHLDAEGNEINFYEKIQRNGVPYAFIDIIKATDSLTYFLGEKYKNLTKDDIFTIDKRETYNFVASVTTKGDLAGNYFTMTDNSCHLTEDNTFIYGGPYNQSNRFTTLIQGFDLQALVNGTLVQTDEICNNSCTQVSVHPNPANDNITLSFDDGFTGDVVIVDIQGNEKYHKTWSGVQSDKIDVSTYPSGMYFVRLVSKDKNHSIKPFKLVKL